MEKRREGNCPGWKKTGVEFFIFELYWSNPRFFPSHEDWCLLRKHGRILKYYINHDLIQCDRVFLILIAVIVLYYNDTINVGVLIQALSVLRQVHRFMYTPIYTKLNIVSYIQVLPVDINDPIALQNNLCNTYKNSAHSFVVKYFQVILYTIGFEILNRRCMSFVKLSNKPENVAPNYHCPR